MVSHGKGRLSLGRGNHDGQRQALRSTVTSHDSWPTADMRAFPLDGDARPSQGSSEAGASSVGRGLFTQPGPGPLFFSLVGLSEVLRRAGMPGNREGVSGPTSGGLRRVDAAKGGGGGMSSHSPGAGEMVGENVLGHRYVMSGDNGMSNRGDPGGLSGFIVRGDRA